MPLQHTQRPLQNRKVLVTRPAQRAADLCHMIEQAGGIPLQFAAIEITEPADSSSREYAREHIAEFSLAIFISPTAVEKTIEYMQTLPADLGLSAIGSRTARTLESRGFSLAIQPRGHDTESLLALPQMQPEQIAGTGILIFKGEGGRELLGDSLQARGARVYYADMYRRSAPSSAEKLDQFLLDTDVITVSSNEGLQNLYDLASDKPQLTAHYLVVPGERALTLAKKLGFSNIAVAQNATDGAIFEALKNAITELSKKT